MKQTIPKKLASGVVAAAMTLSLLPAAALAADSEYSASGATGFAFTDSGIAAEDGSYTGYKISGTDLTIRGLTLNITAPVNDAINAEQTLNIESGTLNISAGDDAIHCDYVINVGASGTTGPSITIKACYEGLEAATLNILSGNISILSEDDCLNAANSDLTGYSFSIKDSSDNSNGSSAPQPVQSCGFTDVAASDWFYSAVRYAYENGLMTGTGSGAFSPNRPSRAECS